MNLTTRRIAFAGILAALYAVVTVLEGWQKNPDTMLTTLYMDALREMLKRTPNKFVVHKTDESATQDMRLHIGLNPEEKKAPARRRNSARQMPRTR